MKNITNKLDPSLKIDNPQIGKDENKKDLTKTSLIKEQEKKVVANESNGKGKTKSLDMKKKGSNIGSKLTTNNSTVKGNAGENKTNSNNVLKKNNKIKKSKVASSGKSKINELEERENEDINILLSEKKDNENENINGYKILVENIEKKKRPSKSPSDNNHLNTESLNKSEKDHVKNGLISKDQLKYTERVIKEEEDDEDEDKIFNPNFDSFNGVSLTDQNLLILTESSRGREEKDNGKDSFGVKTPQSNRSEVKTNIIPSIIKFLHPKIFSKILSKYKKLPKHTKIPRDENRFLNLKIINSKEEEKEKETKKSPDRKTAGIVRVKKKKAVSLVTKDLKATDEEKSEIERKIMKYIEVDLVNLADQDMNEELRRKNELYIFNINQDIEYQLSKGTLTEEEKIRYQQLKENINSMKIDMKSFVKDFEKSFLNFKGEIENLEEVRKNEERINSYYYYLNDSRMKVDVIRRNINRKIKVVDKKLKCKLNPILYDNITDNISQQQS